VGITNEGAPMVAVFSTGIDLDVVPFAADARVFHESTIGKDCELVVVVPARDASPVTVRMADLLRRPARIVGL
jgi:hypothetical protein